MLKDISKYKFYGRSHFVQLQGKYTAQCTHCALYKEDAVRKKTAALNVTINF